MGPSNRPLASVLHPPLNMHVRPEANAVTPRTLFDQNTVPHVPSRSQNLSVLCAAPEAGTPCAEIKARDMSLAAQKLDTSYDSNFGTLCVRKPFAEIENDLDEFADQFVRAAAEAAGVAPHRIRIRDIRASVT